MSIIQTMPETVFDDIHDEHERLDLFFSEITRALAQPEMSRPHVVMGLMAELVALLQNHFAHEEDGGYFTELVEVYPRVAETVERLRQQHRTMLATVRAIHGHLARTADRESCDPAIRRDFLQFVQQCDEHQHEENSLVQEAFCQDIGASD
jgi:hypothetical protein